MRHLAAARASGPPGTRAGGYGERSAEAPAEGSLQQLRGSEITGAPQDAALGSVQLGVSLPAAAA